jgi:transcriptional regulator with XRE-family HTH domain
MNLADPKIHLPKRIKFRLQPDFYLESDMPRNDLGAYVKRVMKLSRLTQKEVQRRSGGKITDGYIASISIGRATNLSVGKLKALADGLGVDLDNLFHIASGRPEGVDNQRGNATDALMLLETVQKAVASPDVIQILDGVVSLSSEERASLLGLIKRLGSTKRKPRRKTKPV